MIDLPSLIFSGHLFLSQDMVDLIIIGFVGRIGAEKEKFTRIQGVRLSKQRVVIFFSFFLSDKMLNLLSGNSMANRGQTYPLGTIYIHQIHSRLKRGLRARTDMS